MNEESVTALTALIWKPALYHCVSRIVNRDFVLKRPECEELVRLMRRYERFSQVKVWTYCVMSSQPSRQVAVAKRDGFQKDVLNLTIRAWHS